MTEIWIPLWLLEDMISSLRYRLEAFAKKENAELEKTDILITDSFDDAITIYLRGYDNVRKDYAYVKRAITKKIIQQTRYSPEPKLKTMDEMFDEISGLLETERDE